LLQFFSQLHTPGLTAVGSDAALTSLRLDTHSEVFMRLQLDAEFRQLRGQGAKRVMPEVTGARSSTEDPPSKKLKLAGEKKKASAYCFAFSPWTAALTGRHVGSPTRSLWQRPTRG
jgi:hypothetical protein